MAGLLELDGDLGAFGVIMANIVDFDPMFNIFKP